MVASELPTPRDATPRYLFALHALFLVVIGLAWMPDAIVVDDAWITFRYADQLAAGNGLVYNEGEGFLGVTATLYAVILGSLTAVSGVDITVFVVLIQLAALVLAGFVVPLLLVREGERPVWAWGLLFVWVLASAPTVVDTMGMETVLFASMGLFIILVWAHGRDAAFGALASLYCMVRPDGVFLGALLFSALWLSRRRFPVRALVAGVTAAVPWLVYSVSLYGSPVPATAAAKLHHSESGLWREDFVDQLWPVASDGGFLAVTVLAVVGALVALRLRDRIGMAVLVWLLVHNGAFVVTAVAPFPWYYVAFIAQLAFLAIFALARGIEAASRRWPALRGSAVHAGALVLLGLVLTGTSLVEHGERPLVPRNPDPVEDRYFHLGEWIAENTPEDARVAALEVGIVGYFSRRHMVDLVGLVTAGVSEEVAERNHVPFAMETYRPDYFVLHVPHIGHEDGLPAYTERGFVPVYAIEDCVLYRRWEGDEADLVERVAASLGDSSEGVVLVPHLPAWLDFDACRELAAARPDAVPLTRAPSPEVAWVAHLQGDGSFRAEPYRGNVAAAFDGAELEEDWEPINIVPDEVGGSPRRWFSENNAPQVRRRLDLEGPLSRVRVRMHVEDLQGRPSGHGTVAWTSAANQAFDLSNLVVFPIQVTDGFTEFVAELPRHRFGAGETLQDLLVSPMDGPGIFALEEIVIERY